MTDFKPNIFRHSLAFSLETSKVLLYAFSSPWRKS